MRQRGFMPRASTSGMTLVSVIAFLLVVAALAGRFYRIGDHFAHVDDLVAIAGPYVVRQGLPFQVDVPIAGAVEVDATRIKQNPLAYAAYMSTTTYGPLQYFFYPLVVGGEYSYREFLVRGRLPSAVAASVAVVLFWLFCRSFFGKDDPAYLIPLAFFAFSLMHITYSQQAMPYSAGVMVVTLMLWMTHTWAGDDRPLWQFVTPLAILAYANYQVLAMTPLAVLAVIVARYFGAGSARGLHLWCGAGAVLLLLVLIAPGLALAMARDSPGRLAVVPGFEAYFPDPPDSGLLAQIAYFPEFIVRGLGRVVWTNLLVAQASPLAGALAFAFAPLSALGLVALWRRPDSGSRAALLLIAAVLTMWLALNLLNRFPLSPSRHVLALAPMILFSGAVGLRAVLAQVQTRAGLGFTIGAVVLIVFLFVRGYPAFREERADRFNEAAIEARLHEHQLDTVAVYGDTWQPVLMFRTRPSGPDVINLDAIVRKGNASRRQLPDESILLVSQYGLPNAFPDVDAYLRSHGYRVVPLDAISSEVQQGISRDIKWGTNGYYTSVGVKEAR